MKELYESAPNLTKGEWREGSYLWKWDLIWNDFWSLKDSLSFSIRWCDDDTSSEEDIKAYWKTLCEYLYNQGNELCKDSKTRELGIELKKIRLSK